MPLPHALTIVIPALNEEEAIGSTLRRCLEARASIRSRAQVGEIEIVVVSDGSSDRTEEIARSFEEVGVLAFDENRGYGAAIQCGFAHGRGDLLAFLDADGTCDPRFFGELCRAIDEEHADIALGSRMGADSAMPWIRSFGNTLFAWMLGILAQQRVSDTASGMRVIRRSALADLHPLPDGMHFTPAMSARALIDGKLRLVERPMAYAERVGRSKLHVVGDGARFLGCIVRAAVAYRPARPLLLAGALVALGAAAVGAGPVLFYAAHGRLEEWMIYRLLLASLLATLCALCVATAVVAERVSALAHGRARRAAGLTGAASRVLRRRNGWWLGLVLTASAVWLVRSGIHEYSTTGHVEMHWSRAALASLLVTLAAALGATAFLLDMLDLIERERAGLDPPRPPDRIRPARSSREPAPGAG